MPTLRDYLHVFLDKRLDERQLVLLEAVVIYHLDGLHIVLCLAASVVDVYMHRLVVVGLEHEPQSKECEYCWHNLFFFQYNVMQLFLL